MILSHKQWFLICVGLFLSVFCETGYGQLAVEWQKCLGGSKNESAKKIIKTADNGYLIVGSTYSGDGQVTGFHPSSFTSKDIWVVKTDSIGDLEWQKCLGNSQDQQGVSAVQTLDGSYMVFGSAYRYNSPYEDLPQSHHGAFDFWVIKLDNTGNILWSECLGGGQDEFLNAAEITPDQGFILAGSTLSIDGDVTGLHAYRDFWVVKTDSLANIQHQRCLGGFDHDVAYDVTCTTDGGYIVTGSSKSNNGDATFNHQTSGGYATDDVWVVKLDSAFNIQWQRSYGGSGTDNGYSIRQTTDGGFIICGETSSMNGDVTGIHGNWGPWDFWLLKIDAGGNIQWNKCLGGTGFDYGRCVIQTQDGGYLACGEASSTDGDVTAPGYGQDDAWLVKTDHAGNVEWDSRFGGSGIERAFSLQQHHNSIIIAGETSSAMMSGNLNHGQIDLWISSTRLADCFFTGQVFADINSNSLIDSGDSPLAHIRLSNETGTDYYFSDISGRYIIPLLDTGMHSVSIIPQDIPLNYFAVPSSHSHQFTSPNETDSMNHFAIQPQVAFIDLCANITPPQQFRQGRPATYKLNYKNAGSTIISPTVVFFPDDDITFDSAIPAPSYSSPDSVVWHLGPLYPFEPDKTILVNITVKMTSVVGTIINSGVAIFPISGDINPICNQSWWEVPVTGSYDPNDIRVNKDTLLKSEIPGRPELEYVIRFQNTGNDTAFYVRVDDYLPKELDFSSMKMIASSHPAQLKFNNRTRRLSFEFDKILLPDSNVNETGSHGFVHYSIRTKSTLNTHEEIHNRASIFFDFNEPVVTNTAITRIVNQYPGNDPASQEATVYYNSSEQSITIELSFQHNTQVVTEVFNPVGQRVRHLNQTYIPGDHTSSISTSGLTSGIYIVKICAGDNNIIRKLIRLD